MSTFLRAQELFILVCRKSSKAGCKMAWLNTDLLLKQEYKRNAQAVEAVTGDLVEEYRDVV